MNTPRHYPFAQRARTQYCLWERTALPTPPGVITPYITLGEDSIPPAGEDRYDLFSNYIADRTPNKSDGWGTGHQFTIADINPSIIPPPVPTGEYYDTGNISFQLLHRAALSISVQYIRMAKADAVITNPHDRTEYRNILHTYFIGLSFVGSAALGYGTAGYGPSQNIAAYQVVAGLNYIKVPYGAGYLLRVDDPQVITTSTLPTIWRDGALGEAEYNFNTADMLGLEYRYDQFTQYTTASMHDPAVADVRAGYDAIKAYIEAFSMSGQIRAAAHPIFRNESNAERAGSYIY